MIRRIRKFLRFSLLLQGIALLIVLLWRWLSKPAPRRRQHIVLEEPSEPEEPQELLAPAVVEAAPPEPEPDNLRRIEGVGPKISGVLIAAGVRTFAGLAATDVERLREILREGGVRVGDPGTWPEQAALAAAGDWDGLAALQGQLKGGRRVT